MVFAYFTQFITVLVNSWVQFFKVYYNELELTQFSTQVYYLFYCIYEFFNFSTIGFKSLS